MCFPAALRYVPKIHGSTRENVAPKHLHRLCPKQCNIQALKLPLNVSEQILTNDSDSTRAPNNVRSSCSWLEGSWLASHLNHIESHSGPTQFLSTVRIRTRKRTSLTFSTYKPLFARRVLHNISNVHSMFQTQWKAFATIMAYVRPKNLALQASSSNAFICTPCICQWSNNQLMQTAM